MRAFLLISPFRLMRKRTPLERHGRKRHAAKFQYHSLAFDLLNTDNRQDYNSAAAFQATNNPESKLKTHNHSIIYQQLSSSNSRTVFNFSVKISTQANNSRKMARKLKKDREREIGNLFGHKSTSAVSATSFGQQPTHSFINEKVCFEIIFGLRYINRVRLIICYQCID